MKTIIEYEPSDIKLMTADLGENETVDPIHAFILAQILIWGLGGVKQRPEDSDQFAPLRRYIAGFLNAAQKAGISISLAEAVPAVFRE